MTREKMTANELLEEVLEADVDDVIVVTSKEGFQPNAAWSYMSRERLVYLHSVLELAILRSDSN